jgi:hypothetical protein
MKVLLKVIFFAALCLFVSNPCLAKETKTLHGIEFLTGIGAGKIEDQGHYRLVPLIVDLDFDLRPLIENTAIKLPGLFQFVDEPFISYIFDPNNNIEIGNNFLLKIGILPETSKFQPYLKGGIGLTYITQHFREQGTQFNFNESLGMGMHYFFKKNMAFTLEYRRRHLSNAGIKRPNGGVDINLFLGGISYLF